MAALLSPRGVINAVASEKQYPIEKSVAIANRDSVNVGRAGGKNGSIEGIRPTRSATKSAEDGSVDEFNSKESLQVIFKHRNFQRKKKFSTMRRAIG